MGTLYFCLSGFVFCLNFMCGKIIYDRHPDLGANELLVYRSLISIVILSLYLNRNFKRVAFDTVTKSEWPALSVRVVTGNVAIFVNFMAIKYFKLTIVAMIVNCAPILTLILAGPILGEKV